MYEEDISSSSGSKNSSDESESEIEQSDQEDNPNGVKKPNDKLLRKIRRSLGIAVDGSHKNLIE